MSLAHPIREPGLHAEVERKASIVEKIATAGKLVVEFDLKDGQWVPGRVSYIFPRENERRPLACQSCGARMNPASPRCPNCSAEFSHRPE